MGEILGTTDPAKPRRRLYRFRLRTLLIGVAVAGAGCAVVSREAMIVRERRSFLATVRTAGGTVFTREGDFVEAERELGRHLDRDASPPEVPLLRRWLGDEDVSDIWLPPNSTRSDWERARNLFPEASVQDWNVDFSLRP